MEMPRLLKFIERVKMDLGLGPGSVSIRLVNDAEMARLNETYRHKKGTTDVLSFPAEERRRPGNLRRQLRKYVTRNLEILQYRPWPPNETPEYMGER